MSLKDHNTTRKNPFTFDSSALPYIKVRDLEPGKSYPLRSMFITPDNGYGEGAVLVTDFANVNVPQRYVDTIRGVWDDPESVDQVNRGEGSFHYVVGYSKKFKKETYDIIFE